MDNFSLWSKIYFPGPKLPEYRISVTKNSKKTENLSNISKFLSSKITKRNFQNYFSTFSPLCKKMVSNPKTDWPGRGPLDLQPLPGKHTTIRSATTPSLISSERGRTQLSDLQPLPLISEVREGAYNHQICDPSHSVQ